MATSYAKDSLLLAGKQEERALLALSMLHTGVPDEFYHEVFASRLNWPWILMQAMQHRVICIVWDNLKKQRLVEAAVRSGLAKNWIVYAEQLYQASLAKNTLWLGILERVLDAAERADLTITCIKGAALIGDIYGPEQRMLGDIDALAPCDRRSQVSALLHDLGFRHGIVDPATWTLKPLSREKQRFWTFSAHLMPKFTMMTGDTNVPFLRLAIGFDLFDPHDAFHLRSESLLPDRRRIGLDTHRHVLSEADTVISLCAHIYREAVSATFGFASENWGLWKFCDLRTYLLHHGRVELREVVRSRVEELGLQKPYFFAMHYLKRVYGDPLLQEWEHLCDPGPDTGFLSELVDGPRRAAYDRPFAEWLFDLDQTVVPGLKPAWAEAMPDGEWW